jgi:AcrR family transcriptional regulator
MNDTNIIEPKERIIKAAAALFAEKGYAAVGVREISKSADVNISMISYYFNGKIGIFKAIVEDFLSEHTKIVLNISKKFKKLIDNKENFISTKEEILKTFVKDMVGLIRSKTNICKVTLIEFPLDIKEVQEMKTQLIWQHIELLKKEFMFPHKKEHPDSLNIIVGTAILSMIFSNFLLGNVAKILTKNEFDDDFYDEYTEIISTMILGSMKSLDDKLYSKKQAECC